MPAGVTLLLGRASYGARRTAELEALARALAGCTGGHVEWAVLDGNGPSLPSVLDRVAAAGGARAVVVPVTLPSDVELERWAQRVAAHWLGGRDGRQGALELVVTPPLAEAAGLASALAAHVAAHAGSRPLRPSLAPANSPDWSVLPAHRHHILVCRGPRCTAAGAGDVAAALDRALAARGIGDEGALVAGTGCLYPCNLGPTVVVYPEGAWYGGMTPAAAERLVDEHLLGGRPLEDMRIVPGGDAR